MRRGIACLVLVLIGLSDVPALGQTGAFAPNRSAKRSTRTRSARQATPRPVNVGGTGLNAAGGGLVPFGTVDPLAAANPALIDPFAGQYFVDPFGGIYSTGPASFAVSGGGSFGTGTTSTGATTATGGLTSTDRKLIHGFDGDGVGELRDSVGDISHPRVQRLHRGDYIEGYEMQVRKGEIVNGGNYIPGFGVIGSTTSDAQGGVYTPGRGVTGSFDPRDSNFGNSTAVQGGTYTPGFGVMGSGASTGFGSAGGIPSAYGASSLAPTYGGFGATPFGAGSVPFNASGAGTIPSAYGAGSLAPSYGSAGIRK